MKQIRIKSLALRNFKGFTFTLTPDGNDVSVFGKNATGKSTIADGWHWLLFDKDSLSRGDFEIKPILPNGEYEHNVESCVEAVLMVGDTLTILSKTFKEVYQRKRGSAEQTFTGHTSEYAINGVPVKMSDYKNQVSELLGEESAFRLLTSPSAFPSLPWQKARSILLEICGDVPDSEIIAADETLSPLRTALAKYTVSKTPLDDLKKVTMGRRTEINKALDSIPIRIDEARRGLPDVTGLDKASLSAEITALEADLNGAKLRLAGVDTGGKIAPLTKDLNTVIAGISGLENAHYLKYSEDVTKLNQQIREFTSAREADERKFKSTKAEIEEKKARIAAIDKQLDLLRDKWNGIDGEEFQDSTAAICPACGQSLPEDRVEAAREKARAAFNVSKAERLAQVQADGKRTKTERDRIVGEIEQLSAQDYPDGIIPQNPEIDRLTAERDTAKATATDYSLIDGRQDLLDRKTALEKAIQDAKGSVSEDRAAITQEIGTIEPKLQEVKEKAGRFDYLSLNNKRIQDLKAEEKKLAGEFEELEKLLYLIETFIKKKVSLLTDRINGKFEMVRFKLFDVLVNQGIEETCEMTVGGVGWNSGLNNAARINGGLDVIRTLQKHYGIAPPVFCDNAESVVDLYRLDCQMIRLIVSGKDRNLRIEHGIASDELFSRRAVNG